MHILSHRGISQDKNLVESTYQAFAYYLTKNFGIEFDVSFTKDNKIIIFHDTSLTRITDGHNQRLFSRLRLKETKKINLNGSNLCDFDQLMHLIIRNEPKINALHLKGKFQKKKYLDILIKYLQEYHDYLKKIIIFDIKVNTAKYLKTKLPKLMLAPSVAHPYDIKRYNSCVNNTLISLDEAIDNKNLFDWVWLDEWDLSDDNGGTKKLYTEETFSRFRNAGLKIVLVTPELHASSPGLLGGEAHPDAKTMEQLDKRLREIIELAPDAVCTDYPDLVRRLTLS